jgi:hypothetical protein
MAKVKLINWDVFEYEIKESHKIEKSFVKIILPFLGEDYQWFEVKEWEFIDQKISDYLRSRSQHLDESCKKFENVESKEEKQEDRTELEKARDAWFKYFVNITTEDNAKRAVIHDIDVAIATMIEFDAERWDMLFEDEEQAQKYAKEFNSKQ